MTRDFLRIVIFLGLTSAVAAASRTTAVGPVTGSTQGVTANEIELRLPLILSRALKKIVLKNQAASRFVFPNQFAEFLKARKIESKTRFTLPEYEQLRGAVDAGGILTVELIPSEQNSIACLNYFDYSTYALTSIIVTSDPLNLTIQLAKHFMQIETRRMVLDTIKPGAKLVVLTSLDPVQHNTLMLHFMEQGYRLASLPDNAGYTPTDLSALREFDSNGLSYNIPRYPLKEEEIKLILSPVSDEDEENFLYETTTNQYMRFLDGIVGEMALAGASLTSKTGADYLLVFSERGKDSFARAMDLKTGNIVWQQDGFPDAASSSLADIAAALTQSLNTPPPVVNTDQFKLMLDGGRPGVAGQSGGLASVAILDFYDRTNSKLFGYLSSSLSQAADDSMQRIFEFQRLDPGKGNTAGATHLKAGTAAEKSALKAFQQQTGADYLIFGDYVYDKKSKKVTIRAQAYDLVRLIPVSNQSLESPVDATLFTAVDQISERIVQDILLLAQQ